MNPAPAGVSSASSIPDSRTMAVAATIAGIVFAGDFLLWGAKPGVSLAIFVALLGGLMMWNGVRTRRSWWAAGLLALSSFQFAVEICFSGVLVAVVLLIVLLGETEFALIRRGYQRWLEAAWAIIQSPGRWLCLGRVLVEDRRVVSGVEQVTAVRMGKVAQILLPGIALIVVFGFLLSAGNAVFGDLAGLAGWHLAQWMSNFDWSPGRFVLWLLLIGLGIALLWPPAATGNERWWTRTLPRWVREDPGVAFWQSGFALAVTNVLFFVANTIDAVYLWADGVLPEGVNPSAFVHNGVHSLIVTVALAALVLTVVFQQSAPVTESRVLRWLALAWIVQNLVLMGGVVLRLKLYVDAYQLSELRVYVGCFLLLVSIGFVLLAQHVIRGMRIGSLIRQNLAVTFGLFFMLQFPDIGRAVADLNVRHWKDRPDRILDLTYLESLGASGWPALITVARSGREPMAAAAAAIAHKTAIAEERRLGTGDWRAIQWRRDLAARRLISEVAFR